MNAGGPTDVREPYFKEAVDEMLRARKLCAIANAKMPDDASYVADLEELFGCKLDDVRILTPFICDFGNRVNFGKGVFINHSAILSASGGIEFEDGVMLAPAVHIATINHDFNERHTKYTYGKVTIRKNAWIGMGATICPGDHYDTYGRRLRYHICQSQSWLLVGRAASLHHQYSICATDCIIYVIECHRTRNLCYETLYRTEKRTKGNAYLPCCKHHCMAYCFISAPFPVGPHSRFDGSFHCHFNHSNSIYCFSPKQKGRITVSLILVYRNDYAPTFQ
jgi:acetyltransferase-like isoleucine patch superfamily enzyme